MGAPFDYFVNHIQAKMPAVFFVDVPAGSGKTSLCQTLLAHVRSQGSITIATPSSGISAILTPGGRTVHSRFQIPITLDAPSTCNIHKQSNIADLISRAVGLLLDEARMTHALEARDHTLKTSSLHATHSMTRSSYWMATSARDFPSFQKPQARS